MEDNKHTYVIAVRKELRGVVPADWQRRVQALVGVPATNPASRHRLQVVADNEALCRIRTELGEFLYIEPIARRIASG